MMSDLWYWFVIGWKKNDHADNVRLKKHDESINVPQEETTCTNVQMYIMSSGLIGNVSQLSLNGNLCQNWADWLQEFDIYLIVSGYDNQPKIRKISIFLHFNGKSALKI